MFGSTMDPWIPMHEQRFHDDRREKGRERGKEG